MDNAVRVAQGSRLCCMDVFLVGAESEVPVLRAGGGVGRERGLSVFWRIEALFGEAWWDEVAIALVMQVAISSAASISASVMGGLVDSEVWARMLVRSWVVVSRGVIVPNKVSRVVLTTRFSSCFVCVWNWQMSRSRSELMERLGRRWPEGDLPSAFCRWLL